VITRKQHGGSRGTFMLTGPCWRVAVGLFGFACSSKPGIAASLFRAETQRAEEWRNRPDGKTTIKARRVVATASMISVLMERTVLPTRRSI
jgi:hypothetical protein